MPMLILGLALFVGIHLSAVTGLRAAAVARLGEGPWKGLYSLISALGLAAIVLGYGLARQEPSVLWVPPTWTRHLALTLMVPVFPLLLAAYLPGRLRQWAAGHPMLVATLLWATAHLLANGMVADVLLFGSMALWALVVRLSFTRRTQRDIPMAPPSAANDVIAIVGGLGLYVLTLLKAHVWLFGVAPLP
jgi:uncharacterized membrane protein